MDLRLTDSTLSAPNSITAVDLQRAWQILSLMLQTGRPLSLSLVFPNAPDYVTYLCSIADSPILLTAERIVAPSAVAVRAIHNFVSNFGGYVSRGEILGFRDIKSCHKRRKRDGSEFEFPLVLKKRLILRKLDENEKNQCEAVSTSGASCECAKVLSRRGNYMTEGVGKQAISLKLEHRCEQSSKFKYTWEHEHAQSSKCQNIFPNVISSLNIPDLVKSQNTKMYIPYLEQFIQTIPVQKSITWRQNKLCGTYFEQGTRFDATTCMEGEEQSIVPLVEAENVSHACQCKNFEEAEAETVDNSETQKSLAETILGYTSNAMTCMELEKESRAPPVDTYYVSHACQTNNAKVAKQETVDNCKIEKTLVETLRQEGEYAGPTDEMVFLHDSSQIKIELCTAVIPSKDGDITTAKVDDKSRVTIYKPSLRHSQPSKTCARTKTSKTNVPKQEAQCEISGNNRDNDSPSGEMQCAQDKCTVSLKQKLKKKREGSMLSKREHDKSKEGREKPTDTALKNQLEPKPLPNFELYTVEEEEGSGGYGTVYRARRKSDGVTFAIKCPHETAPRHHVVNELKMLERFGGKNFVIKFEGSFTRGGSECLVLEHVQHDRPEILKRKIEVSQLMWYGYCMFKALAALHKQGIVHRDVKPGNFLFSRKDKQGFLIDFNLATDLHQRYGTRSKLKVGYNVSSNHVPPGHAKSFPLANRKLLVNKATESTSKNLVKDSKTQILRNTPKGNTVGAKNAFSGQGADGSGVTSAKDATSTRIPSGQKSKELSFIQRGRKELVTFAHQSRQSGNCESQVISASKRKRVSAPRKMESRNVWITPMPLISNGVEVAGSGRIKDEGERKQNREGQCVGTKGFRAPEVLFRSAHQGPKIDVWSAGVTLLYLVTGRIPFTGEPEQNIKDIAKLRGCEDLWEVAKLHNRVSSFPQELHDVQYLSSVNLRDWCQQITRRPEFFREIPMSLFDLVDRCLTVNPRLRLSAEEALRHEFFTPCFVDLRRKWPQRKESNSDSGTSHLLQK